MINQFLQLGGVRSVEEFYKKFPTEAHFDNHVHRMKNGGGIYAYAGGGATGVPSKGVSPIKPGTLKKALSTMKDEYDAGTSSNSEYIAPPRRADYMDNEEQWQADMDAYIASQGTGPAAKPVSSNTTVTNSSSTTKSSPSPYGGVSIVDLLASKGKATNYASRKKLAESLGMTGYTGRAGENNRLIQMINSKPDILNNYEAVKESAKSVTKTKAKAKTSKEYQPTQEEINAFMASENARQAKDNPYVMAPGAPGAQTNPSFYGMPWLGQGSANAPVDNGFRPYAPQNQNPSFYGMPWLGQDHPQAAPVDNGFRPYASQQQQQQFYGMPWLGNQRQQPAGVDNGFRPYAPSNPEEKKLYLDFIFKQQQAQQAQDNGIRPYAPEEPYVVPMWPHGKKSTTAKKAVAKKVAVDNGFRPYAPAEEPARYGFPFERGGQTLHPGGDGTYYQGNYFDDGGAFVPNYSDAGSGQLPQYNMGSSYQDGGSPLYSTQGQALRNFMNTVAYTPGGWMPNHIQLPPVGPRRYDDGGMSPDQAAMMAQQQGQQQAPPQQGGGINPQQVMQEVAQMLQQGAQPEQIMQQLVQKGVPQEMAQQIIQQVMQQMQGGQGPQEEQAEGPQGQNPQEEAMEGAPQAMYGMGMKYGGSNNKKGKFANQYKVGGEYNMNDADIKKLIDQGYKIQYV